MICHVVWCALLAAALPAPAWQVTMEVLLPPGPQTKEGEKEKEPGRIEGSVVLASGETPVRKAQLNLYASQLRVPIHTSTDAEGRFVFEKIPPGDYTLSAAHPRFVAADDTGAFRRASSRRVSVAEGQAVKGITFKMMPGAVVTGRVLDEFGDPQPRASVALQRYMFRQGKKQLAPAGMDQTDDRGEYRIFNIPPGRYYVSATYGDSAWSRSVTRSGAPESSYPTVFYPGVLDAETAIAFDLRPGEQRQGVDLRLVPDRAVRVKGRILDAGKPARDAMISIFSKDSSDFGMQRFQPADPRSGEFDLAGLRAGTYVLRAFSSSLASGRPQLQGRLEVSVGSSDVEGLTIPLESGVDIPGELVFEGDGAAPVSLEETPTRVFLTTSEPGLMGTPRPAEVQPDGSFELSGVPAGRYRAQLRPLPEGGYLAGATFGGQDVTGAEFDIAPGAQGPLKLRVRLAAATIAGSVKDDKGKLAPNIKVLIAPEVSRRDRDDLFRLETTDQNGSFAARNLPPGEYRVWALTDVEFGQHMDPDFLASLENEGEKVEAEENGSYNLDLEILQEPGSR